MNKKTKQEAKELFYILIAVLIGSGLITQVHSCGRGFKLDYCKPVKKEKSVNKADTLRIQALKAAQSKTR